MIKSVRYTNRGGREYNEDTCIGGYKENLYYAIIADGLGGHGGGDIASKTAVEVMQTLFLSKSEIEIPSKEEMTEWFHKVNDKILSMQTAECQMRTTLAFLCLDYEKGQALLAHVGDSRIYHFTDGKMNFYTFDHSVSRMAVLAGEITIDEVRFHPDRNKLIKAIGKPSEISAEIEEIMLQERCQHTFLLCTDGFWEYVTEEEMEKTLQKAETPKEWLIKMRKKLKERVPQNHDNNSAIAIFMSVEDKK